MGASAAVVCYIFQIQLARGYVAIALPLGTLLLLLGRYAARRWLHHQRAYGRYQHRVLAVGGAQNVSQLAHELGRRLALGVGDRNLDINVRPPGRDEPSGTRRVSRPEHGI